MDFQSRYYPCSNKSNPMQSIKQNRSIILCIASISNLALRIRTSMKEQLLRTCGQEVTSKSPSCCTEEGINPTPFSWDGSRDQRRWPLEATTGTGEGAGAGARGHCPTAAWCSHWRWCGDAAPLLHRWWRSGLRYDACLEQGDERYGVVLVRVRWKRIEKGHDSAGITD
jgi:hypothetical protein